MRDETIEEKGAGKLTDTAIGAKKQVLLRNIMVRHSKSQCHLDGTSILSLPPMTTRLRPKRNSDARGFTLLEVVVALAILATAFTALLGLHTQNLKTIARDRGYTEALFLAREKLAQIELQGVPEPGDRKDAWVSGQVRTALGFAGKSRNPGTLKIRGLVKISWNCARTNAGVPEPGDSNLEGLDALSWH